MNNSPDLSDTATMPGEGELLFGRVLDGKGAGRPIGWAEAKTWKPAAAGEVLWLHLCRQFPDIAQWLENDVGIPEPTAELLTSDQTRPRAFREGETLVATLRGINFNPGAEPEDMVSMQLWSDGARVFTLRRLPLQTPREILATIDAGKGPKDAGALITVLVEQMVARMNQAIVDMNDHIDTLEEIDPADHNEASLRKISTIRRNCLALKRHMAPQHDALESIARDAPAWFEDHDRREISETIHRLRRYIDDLDISKESAIVLQDEIRAGSLARSEKTSYLLGIVAATFLPLGFVTGLLGINVGGMPGAADSEAFWIVVGLCGLIFVVQLLLFRKWNWL
ncbi:MAG: zinc transporter ZntB [Novosphingobium sp.]